MVYKHLENIQFPYYSKKCLIKADKFGFFIKIETFVYLPILYQVVEFILHIMISINPTKVTVYSFSLWGKYEI